jgi:hypothetical protein
MFKTYKSMSGKDKVQTVDGSLCLIAGVGDIACTPELQLSSVLHVPNFTNNLLSVNQLVDDLNCVVPLSPTHVALQELNTGRIIGVGKRSEGLYWLNQGRKSLNQRACVAETPKLELLLLHYRLSHIPLIILGKLYPKLYSRYSKTKLVCDACEFDKHIRTTYSSLVIGVLRVLLLFIPMCKLSRITSLSGSRWFVTFIDYHSRMTWLYLLRSKDEVLECFKIFHKMVETQFEKKMKVLRDNDIAQQTTCVSTPVHNGIVEKNRHSEGDKVSPIYHEFPKISLGRSNTYSYIFNQ